MHPTEQKLALYAERDLDVWQTLQVRLHVTNCAECRRTLDDFAESRALLRSMTTSLPEDIHWSRLASEMSANIRLGLVAGQCVSPGPVAPDRFGWKTVLAAACLSGVLVAGWMLNIPHARTPPGLRAREVEIRTSPNGIELVDNGSTLTLMHVSRGAQRPVIVSTPTSLRARFVDEDTGQVTINNVYSE